MAIAVTCSACGKGAELQDGCAGLELECRSCGALIQVPKPVKPSGLTPFLKEEGRGGRGGRGDAGLTKQAVWASRACSNVTLVLVLFLICAGYCLWMVYHLKGRVDATMIGGLVALGVVAALAVVYWLCAAGIRHGGRAPLVVALGVGIPHLAFTVREVTGMMAEMRYGNRGLLHGDGPLSDIQRMVESGGIAMGVLIVAVLFWMVLKLLRALAEPRRQGGEERVPEGRDEGMEGSGGVRGAG